MVTILIQELKFLAQDGLLHSMKTICVQTRPNRGQPIFLKSIHPLIFFEIKHRLPLLRSALHTFDLRRRILHLLRSILVPNFRYSIQQIKENEIKENEIRFDFESTVHS
ncbi:unnamed protein product [Lactuca virosa]|uniref:Uncharacterized protein n=1 Tax=Lactuca virosa TaxID=75947 RepID=A0AAU9MP44_9ASTR|nr:unnamed protein product [Lactuca virosa]